MRKDLKYDVLVDCMLQMPQGMMGYREQTVVFRKGNINHMARIITYVDIKKGKRPKFVSLLTNDFDMLPFIILLIEFVLPYNLLFQTNIDIRGFVRLNEILST